jgi:hypothetical protein
MAPSGLPLPNEPSSRTSLSLDSRNRERQRLDDRPRSGDAQDGEAEPLAVHREIFQHGAHDLGAGPDFHGAAW